MQYYNYDTNFHEEKKGSYSLSFFSLLSRINFGKIIKQRDEKKLEMVSRFSVNKINDDVGRRSLTFDKGTRRDTGDGEEG